MLWKLGRGSPQASSGPRRVVLAVEELECRRVLSASILQLPSDFSKALSDANSAFQSAGKAGVELGVGLATGNKQELQQASKDWTAAQNSLTQLQADRQQIANDLSIDQNIQAALASLPSDAQIRAAIVEMFGGGAEYVQGFLTGNKALRDKGKELLKRGNDRFHKAINDTLHKILQLAPKISQDITAAQATLAANQDSDNDGDTDTDANGNVIDDT
jgi:hypothetical protein